MSSEERLYSNENRNKHLKRQAEALEGIEEQLRIQNAALLNQTYAIEKLISLKFTGTPAEATDLSNLAARTEDAALDLLEGVDLEAVDRVGDDHA